MEVKMWTILKKLNINTIILLLILMMMFGEYSQRYYSKASWGTQWNMEVIAPAIYYISAIVAIVLCLLLAARIIVGLIQLIRR